MNGEKMLTAVIERDLIIPELQAKDKEGAIKEMASKFKKAEIIKNEDVFIKAVNTREALESTAIGGFIAIPHARSDTVMELTVALGKSSQGIEFKSLDNKPVHLIFMIACPPSETKTYLQVLAGIARLCKNEKIRKRLIKTKDVDKIMCFLEGFNIGFGKPEPVKIKNDKTKYTGTDSKK